MIRRCNRPGTSGQVIAASNDNRSPSATDILKNSRQRSHRSRCRRLKLDNEPSPSNVIDDIFHL